MLIWICALHCEAKPIIDYYRLKKSHDDNAFDLYRGDDMLCVISGIGKIASAAATAWVARDASGSSPAWINLGTAGAAGQPIGSVFLLDKIVDADSGQRYYPPLLERSSIASCASITLSQASRDYRDDYLYDLEASGFMFAALRFSSAELIRCIKVVSDNRDRETGRDRQAVSDLIQSRIESISAVAADLHGLGLELASLEVDVSTWRELTSRVRFSQTQKSRLRGLLRYLLNREYSADDLLHRLSDMSSANAVIDNLEQMSRQDSESL